MNPQQLGFLRGLLHQVVHSALYAFIWRLPPAAQGVAMVLAAGTLLWLMA